MSEKGYGNGTIILAVLLGVVIGAVGGFYVRFWNEPERPITTAAGGETATPMGGAGGARQGGGMPGMVAGPASSGGELARLVRNLAVIQKVQHQGLTREQARSLLPVFKALKDAEKLSEEEAAAKLDEIDRVLTPGQRDALAAMAPFRGMGGRTSASGAQTDGRPPARPMAGALSQPGGGGTPGGGAPPASGMAMGGDPERPFATERNAAALDDLIGAVEVLSR